jgi:hypothetical protein
MGNFLTKNNLDKLTGKKVAAYGLFAFVLFRVAVLLVWRYKGYKLN